VAAVAADAIAGVLAPAPPVVVRKRNVLLDGDAFPLVTVSLSGREEFEPAWTDAAGGKWYFVRYNAAVCFDWPVGGKAGENPPSQDARDAAWAALADYRNLAAAGLTEANDAFPRGGPAPDPGPLARQVERSALFLVVETLELR